MRSEPTNDLAVIGRHANYRGVLRHLQRRGLGHARLYLADDDDRDRLKFDAIEAGIEPPTWVVNDQPQRSDPAIESGLAKVAGAAVRALRRRSGQVLGDEDALVPKFLATVTAGHIAQRATGSVARAHGLVTGLAELGAQRCVILPRSADEAERLKRRLESVLNCPLVVDDGLVTPGRAEARSLPSVAVDHSAGLAETEPGLPPLAGRTIVFIEDDGHAQSWVQGLMERVGETSSAIRLPHIPQATPKALLEQPARLAQLEDVLAWTEAKLTASINSDGLDALRDLAAESAQAITNAARASIFAIGHLREWLEACGQQIDAVIVAPGASLEAAAVVGLANHAETSAPTISIVRDGLGALDPKSRARSTNIVVGSEKSARICVEDWGHKSTHCHLIDADGDEEFADACWRFVKGRIKNRRRRLGID